MFFPAQPAPQLTSFVHSYVQIQAYCDEAVLFWPIPARSFTCLEFTFGNPYRIHRLDGSRHTERYPSHVIGPKTYSQIRLELHGCVETFGILFQPMGLQRLFSVPGSKIVNDHFDAQAVLGPAIKALHSRLEEAIALPDRVRIADEYFSARLPASNLQSDIAMTAREIIARQGHVQIQQLADTTGWSLRHFERRFAEAVGITPKLYARIARFEAAVHRKATAPATNWTEIAHEFHYHDQMHMIHDFTLLSGASPTSLVSQLADLMSTVPCRQE